jgi:hypothetical protein
MTWDTQRNFDTQRRRDPNVMFAVHYEDGRTAYMTVAPRLVAVSDYLVPQVARDRQAKGQIPEGSIAKVKRVR